jgi:membrane protein implicated in regulation of membrane protease activity
MDSRVEIRDSISSIQIVSVDLPAKSTHKKGRQMLWWQWIVLGVVLLGSEIIVDAEFYMVFLGAAALLVGIIGLAPLTIPWWGQWLLFSAFAIVGMTSFRSYFHSKIRGHLPDMDTGLNGEQVTALELIAPGDQGAVESRGTRWVAKNVGESPLEPNSRARVESSSGVMLNVSAENKNS